MIYFLQSVLTRGAVPKAKTRDLENLLLDVTLHKMKSTVEENLSICKSLTVEDGKKLASLARSLNLFWEAYKISAHFKLHLDAMKVLIDDLKDFSTAATYAKETDNQECWKELGRGYLQYDHYADCLEVFQKHRIATLYEAVMDKALANKQWEEVVRFLLMAQRELTDEKNSLAIEKHLIFSYARIWPRRMPEFRAHVQVEEDAAAKLDLPKIMEELRSLNLEDQAKIIDVHLNPPPVEPEVPVKKGRKG